MDALSEIKKFEHHPDHANFSQLQVNDFYKTVIGKTVSFEAIISDLHKGDTAYCDIYADTYSYIVRHNPVSERDYIEWGPDLALICESERYPNFNPLTDLLKGKRFRGEGTVVAKEDKAIRIKLKALERIPFLEVEKEKDLLEKKFKSAYEEMTVYAPQRQYQKKTFETTLIYGIIGGVIGAFMGLFLGGLRAMFDTESSILAPGFEGFCIGAAALGSIGLVRGLLKPRAI